MVYYNCCTDGLCSYQSMHILLLSNNWQLCSLTYIKFSYLIQALNFVFVVVCCGPITIKYSAAFRKRIRRAVRIWRAIEHDAILSSAYS